MGAGDAGAWAGHTQTTRTGTAPLRQVRRTEPASPQTAFNCDGRTAPCASHQGWEDLMNTSHVTGALLAAAGLLAVAPGSAAAQSLHGPYVAAGLGYDSMPDRDLNINGFQVSSQWKSGPAIFAALGYRWSPNLRFEIEGSGRE